ncbi:hypothetical protein [Amylibacter marinus]|nr:hypothetical protein [Amylibacter marinus]
MGNSILDGSASDRCAAITTFYTSDAFPQSLGTIGGGNHFCEV